MMEMIRSWRTLSFGGFGRAALERIRAWRILHFTKWTIAVLLIGMLTGAMAVVLPPLASIGVVAMLGVLLLWAMPDLHVVPDQLLRKMFFVMVVVQLCVPSYYAIDTGILPWISVRRLFSLIVILLFALTVAASQAARERITGTVRNNRLLAVCAFGFLLMNFLSIFTSSNVPATISSFVDTLLNWYVPFCACLLLVRTDEDVIFLLKIIVIAAIANSAAGVLEFILQRRYYFDIFPKSVLEPMLATNPALSAMYNTTSFRNGLYRASSIYAVPLSFGELAAITAPIGAYFLFHASTLKWRLLGGVTILATVIALVCAGARGGFVAFIVTMPIMLFLWTVRYSKVNPGSLVSALMGAIFLTGVAAAIGLVIFSGRLSAIVFGGGDAVSSTDARFVQWQMALPHIISNPVTGHGAGTSGDVVGYFNPGGTIPSVDSYIISLLVEVGIPGFLFFAGMIVIGVLVGVRLYIGSADPRSAIGAPIACSILAFGVYRLVLSQRENHFLFFLVIAFVFVLSKLLSEQLSQKKSSFHRGLAVESKHGTQLQNWSR